MESNWSWLFLIIIWKLKYYVVKSLLVDKSQYKKNFLDHARSFVMQMGYFKEEKRQWCNDFLGTAWNHWNPRKPNQMVPSPKYYFSFLTFYLIVLKIKVIFLHKWLWKSEAEWVYCLFSMWICLHYSILRFLCLILHIDLFSWNCLSSANGWRATIAPNLIAILKLSGPKHWEEATEFIPNVLIITSEQWQNSIYIDDVPQWLWVGS